MLDGRYRKREVEVEDESDWNELEELEMSPDPLMNLGSNEDLLKILGELVASIRELKDEVSGHKIALQNCASCKGPSKSGCLHNNPCYAGVTCYDSSSGPRCGPWYNKMNSQYIITIFEIVNPKLNFSPENYLGDGKTCRPRNPCEEDRPCSIGNLNTCNHKSNNKQFFFQVLSAFISKIIHFSHAVLVLLVLLEMVQIVMILMRY